MLRYQLVRLDTSCSIITLLNARLLLLADLNMMFGIPKVIPQIASPVYTNTNGTINPLLCKIMFQKLLLPIKNIQKCQYWYSNGTIKKHTGTVCVAYNCQYYYIS